jgi:hypothetical protein
MQRESKSGAHLPFVWSADIPVRLGRGSTTEADKNVRAPFFGMMLEGQNRPLPGRGISPTLTD